MSDGRHILTQAVVRNPPKKPKVVEAEKPKDNGRCLNLTPTIVTLCKHYQLQTFQDNYSVFPNVEGWKYNPYGCNTDEDDEANTIPKLMQQMLTAIFHDRDSSFKRAVEGYNATGEEYCIYGMHVDHRQCESSKYISVTIGLSDGESFTAPICTDCQTVLLKIHSNMGDYLSIMVQYGDVFPRIIPGKFRGITKKNPFGCTTLAWEPWQPINK